jgi:hypothetical protein
VVQLAVAVEQEDEVVEAVGAGAAADQGSTGSKAS